MRRHDRFLLALIGGFVLLLLNSAYLFGSSAPTLVHFANVALHPALGAVLAIAAIVAIGRRGLPAGATLRLLAVFATAAAALGGIILVTGATRRYEPLVMAHVVAGALAGLALVAVAFTRRPADGSLLASPRVRVSLAMVMLTAAVAGLIAWRAPAARARAYEIRNPLSVPTAMDDEGGGREANPFFPSSSQTNVGGIIPATFFMTSATCGRCHKEIYDEWNASAHHMSSFNNQWYRKSIEYMQDVIGTQPSKWCAGCHDHAVFFNGRFDRPIKEQIDTPEAQNGLGCLSCHAVTHVGGTMGQGDFTVEYPPLHDLAASSNPLLSKTHDALLYLDPKPHREMFLKPFHTDQTPAFCSACHKVHLDVPVNSYRWFRGFNDYDNWQASGVSGEGARSFYYPPKSQTCADCHMPRVPSKDPAARDGMVRSHRFIAANTALPFVNGDAEQLRLTQLFLQSGQISVDIFGIARTAAPDPAQVAAPKGSEPQLASTFPVGEESGQFGAVAATAGPPAEVIGPLDKIPVTVRRGDSVRVEVVVRTRKVGHFFPGGTVDAFDVWVELEATDENGRVILHSGAVDDGGKGPVDAAAHFYRSRQLDEHGNVINKRNAWMTRSVAYARLIPPGAADTIHYRLRVPENAGNKIFLRAKVNYRKFAWWNTQWAFAGVRDKTQATPAIAPAYDDGKWVFTGDTSTVSGNIKSIPAIPITVMAQAEASLVVLPRGAALPDVKAVLNPSVRERWNDYGIGLLLQGDLKGAEAAFQNVMHAEPGYVDGPINVARAQIQEGSVAAAEEMLKKALSIDGRPARAHYFMGLALKALGRYDEALAHFQTASTQYPRDRVVLNQIGRVLFLQRKFSEAITALNRVLAIDPEDLQAHYQLMLCHQGSGNAELAAREQTLYSRFKADESSQSITGEYRLRSPEDNNERQSIHEHGAPTVTSYSSSVPTATRRP
jgi:tetratricopeptide (TPR) repeat protein